MNRALIVRKEWSDKIFNLWDPKLWEMRSSATHMRGTIGIIEGGSGLIVGSVSLDDCFKIDPMPDYCKFHKVSDNTLLEKWPYAWVLSNAKRFEEPIPYTHPKGAVIWVKI